MFDWLGDIISGIGSAIGDTIDFIGSGVGDAIWNAMLKWLYEIIYGAIADFFEMMGNMGSEVFDLEWVQATVKLFTLFGWGLFVAGTAVAIFDVAIEYQCGRANIKTTALNILKGFFACSLIGIVPIELYKFCISLQNTFSHDLVGIASGGINESLSDAGLAALAGMFSSAVSATYGLLNLLCMIAFAYCIDLTVCIVTIVKYFFSPCFVHKLTVEVFICVFNSVYGFALSSIIIHSFKMFSILYIASLKFIFAKKKNNTLTSKKNVKGNIKISGIKLEFSNEEEYIIAPKKTQRTKNIPIKI